MANINYISISGGIYQDTEQGFEPVTISGGIRNADDAGGGSAALTGTAIAGGVTESEIVTGGDTIISTLTGDTWVADGATFEAQRQNIINGITSAQTELTGWNNEVRDNLAVTTVVRTSDTIVTVTLSAQAGYSITANETITMTIPATALTAASEIVATPTFDVTNESAGNRRRRFLIAA